MSRLLRFISGAMLSLSVFLPNPALSQTSSKMAIIGDAGSRGASLDRLKQSLRDADIRSLILPGDNLYKGTYASVWDSWKSENFLFDVVAIGNHTAGYQKEIQYFSMPGESYSTVRSGARFFVLNSDNEKSASTQLEWLDSELSKAQEKLIFLVYHHPTYTVSKSHSWTEKRNFQVKMRRILKSYSSKITAVLLGHDHMTSFLTFGDVPAVVAGGGREVRNESAVSYWEEGVEVRTRFLAPRKPHWALLEIDEATETAKIHFVRVEDQELICSAFFQEATMRLEKNCTQNLSQ